MSHPADGHPQYGGWMAIHSFYLDRGLSKEQIDEMPLYYALLGMGAISKDKTNLKFSERDRLEYQVAKEKKRLEAQRGGL